MEHFSKTRHNTASVDVQTHKYNGKELDLMHGLNEYDYGARQHDPAICQFTSMDPLCEMYYHISPYVYCGGNPVNRVDIDGRVYGDYFNIYGNYIGSDGADDKRIYIVQDMKESKQIRDKGGIVETGALLSAVDIGNASVLEASLGVMKRTKENGVRAEECAVVNDKGEITQGFRGKYQLATLPAVQNAEASVHSHCWEPIDNELGDLTTNMSPIDAQTFQNYELNVIAGRINPFYSIQDPNTIGVSKTLVEPKLGYSFYTRNTSNKDSTYAPYITLGNNTIKKIIKHYNSL